MSEISSNFALGKQKQQILKNNTNMDANKIGNFYQEAVTLANKCYNELKEILKDEANMTLKFAKPVMRYMRNADDETDKIRTPYKVEAIRLKNDKIEYLLKENGNKWHKDDLLGENIFDIFELHEMVYETLRNRK